MYADHTKMLQGHIPQAMEDKWNIKTDEPANGNGNAIVHIYLGWTLREEITLEIAVGDSDKPEAKDWAAIVKTAWRAEHPDGIKISENEAKIRAIRLCNNLLGCGLEEEEEEAEDEDEGS